MTNPFWIIIPVYNRKAVTLACLGMLRPLLDTGWKVVVVDDGSTDGTSDAIQESFPEVSVLSGGGELYWTGAMELGMRHAYDAGAACCIWLNDDVTVTADAIESVAVSAMVHRAVVSGQGKILHSDGTEWFFPYTYKGWSGLVATPVCAEYCELQHVDSCRGNLVAIPRCVIDAIGFPDGRNIPHVGGDTDYTLRAKAAGFDCLIQPKAVFWEEENIRTDNRSLLLDDRKPRDIIHSLFKKRSAFYPRMLFVYNVRHWGFIGFVHVLWFLIRTALILTIKQFTSKRLRLRLFAKHSHSYQAYLERGIET